MHSIERYTTLKVGGFTPLTTIDYPGALAAVIYCQGCGWRCRYCHNQSLLPLDTDTSFSWREALVFLKRRQGLLDAVVFSGGEPTLQPALGDAMTQIREMGFKIGLHSAGPLPRRIADVLPLIDWIGLDVKALPEDYPATTQVPGSGEAAWESARLVCESGVPAQFRITIHPALISRDQMLEVRSRLSAMGAIDIVEQYCRAGFCLDPGLRNDNPHPDTVTSPN